jgi:hypothetical protein
MPCRSKGDSAAGYWQALEIHRSIPRKLKVHRTTSGSPDNCESCFPQVHACQLPRGLKVAIAPVEDAPKSAHPSASRDQKRKGS